MAPLHYLNAIRGTRNYTEQQKTSGVFLFLVRTKFFCFNSRKNGKGLEGEFCSYIVFYPSLRKSPIKKYTADNQHDPTVPHLDIFWAYRFLEVKDCIVQLHLKPPMIVAECPKLFDVQCICEMILVSLERFFVFKYSQTIYFFWLLREIYMEKS